MENAFHITANLVDPIARRIEPATVYVESGRIAKIERAKSAQCYLMPGFVDSHIHIESSMLLPTEFARVAVTHGTVATVSDPHEIANVCGIPGIELMLRNASLSPLKFHFGVPSCVPATAFETAGASIDANAVANLLDDPRFNHLSEMMNFPGVLSEDAEVMAKLSAAKQRGLPIDGHAPGLMGDEARRYFAAGISTDHECVTLVEAEQKVAAGCKIIIREGSAAKNFDALWPLIDRFPAQCMFGSDDKHPDDLLAGHINQLAVRAVKNGCDFMNVLQATSVNPIAHYLLDVGLLQVGDAADFVLVDDLQGFRVRETYLDGQLVAQDGESRLASPEPEILNHFCSLSLDAAELRVAAESPRIRVIEVIDGQLITGALELEALIEKDAVICDVRRDILKIVVVNRYDTAPPAIGFVTGFRLNDGAIASSVAHDSHNIVAVGTNDRDIASVVNLTSRSRGGLAIASRGGQEILPLPIAGLMSPECCNHVAEHYLRLDQLTRQLGCQLRSPFMTLSFLALPVIPSLKLTDRGLFNVDAFQFVSIFCDNNKAY